MFAKLVNNNLISCVLQTINLTLKFERIRCLKILEFKINILQMSLRVIGRIRQNKLFEDDFTLAERDKSLYKLKNSKT